jgi:sterol desaturase/sphingolipid hydroxylase (fatty acid hydroxylase superfamily)
MVDLTVAAVPGYFGTMGAEYVWQRRAADERGPSAGDYERRDTLASLSMGVGSLVAPLAMARLLRPLTPGRGRAAKALIGLAAGAAAVTTVADLVARRAERAERAGVPDPDGGRRRRARRARQVAGPGGVTALVAGGLALTTAWAWRTAPGKLWERRRLPDLGSGPLALAGAVAAWDFLYYWNHRLSHESRFLWAVHVVHHSSERYNLSTALRQPVADAFGLYLPYGALCLLGFRPEVVETARELNLLYQYWIHTEALGRLGGAEEVFNTPSHHRVHHGSNRRYLDRNHGSVFIVWDRLFGTFEPEQERAVYGLTKNLDSFSPWVIATREHAEMLGDVARSDNWRDRLSFVVRGPGWAGARRAELGWDRPPPGAPVPADAAGAGAPA